VQAREQSVHLCKRTRRAQALSSAACSKSRQAEGPLVQAIQEDRCADVCRQAGQGFLRVGRNSVELQMQMRCGDCRCFPVQEQEQAERPLSICTGTGCGEGRQSNVRRATGRESICVSIPAGEEAWRWSIHGGKQCWRGQQRWRAQLLPSADADMQSLYLSLWAGGEWGGQADLRVAQLMDPVQLFCWPGGVSQRLQVLQQEQ